MLSTFQLACVLHDGRERSASAWKSIKNFLWADEEGGGGTLESFIDFIIWRI